MTTSLVLAIPTASPQAADPATPATPADPAADPAAAAADPAASTWTDPTATTDPAASADPAAAAADPAASTWTDPTATADPAAAADPAASTWTDPTATADPAASADPAAAADPAATSTWTDPTAPTASADPAAAASADPASPTSTWTDPSAPAAAPTAPADPAASSAASTDPAASSTTSAAASPSASAGADSSGGSTGSTEYKCYTGDSYPAIDKWTTFEAMWSAGESLMKDCSGVGGEPNTDAQSSAVKAAAQSVSEDAGIDPRFTLAVIFQESHGCVNVQTTNNGVTNPGLMQSHDGSSFIGNDASEADQKKSITQMVTDGVMGTSSGDGLKQLYEKLKDYFKTARAYNSGLQAVLGGADLNDASGATATYVNDIANWLMGWNGQKGTC